MKFLPSQLAYLTSDPAARGNLRALPKYLAFLGVLVTVYAFLFHVIKLSVENELHSWLTGFYWTLVVMTTLGFGDITFASDTGRVFSIVVLLSGVVFLVVMLPFLFIRLFYAPWLEARVRLRAPRAVPATMRGHVIIAEYDVIAAGFAARLADEGIPYVIIERDPVGAGQLFGDRISVLAGENDTRLTYEHAGRVGAIGACQLRGHDQHEHHVDRARGRSRRADRGYCPRVRSCCCSEVRGQRETFDDLYGSTR